MNQRTWLPDALDALGGLADHRLVLEALLRHFAAHDGVVGAFLSGSTARGGMDVHSDLDLGVVCRDETVRDELWRRRWDWDFHPWFHRFDADHVKPYFVIYLFEPLVKADVVFYTSDDLPGPAGGPYRPVWDDTGSLAAWAAAAAALPESRPDWAVVDHEDERFWAWLVYLALHIRRGELYESADAFGMVRNVTATWLERLAGRPRLSTRRFEERHPEATVDRLARCFPRPERSSLASACRALVALHREVRTLVAAATGVTWTTTETACDRVASVIADLAEPSAVREVDLATEYDAVIDLWQSSGLPCKPRGRDSYERLARELGRSDTNLLAMDVDGRLAATLLVTTDGRKGWLNRLAVRPDCRRRGLGRALVAEGERRLAARGILVVACLIEAGNEASFALARAAGFVRHDDIAYLTKRTSTDA